MVYVPRRRLNVYVSSTRRASAGHTEREKDGERKRVRNGKGLREGERERERKKGKESCAVDDQLAAK